MVLTWFSGWFDSIHALQFCENVGLEAAIILGVNRDYALVVELEEIQPQLGMT
jgi:hypothetical protein